MVLDRKIEKEAEEVVRVVFCHLMDMSWQDYDHLLIRDMQLPEYLFETTISKCGHVTVT